MKMLTFRMAQEQRMPLKKEEQMAAGVQEDMSCTLVQSLPSNVG